MNQPRKLTAGIWTTLAVASTAVALPLCLALSHWTLNGLRIDDEIEPITYRPPFRESAARPVAGAEIVDATAKYVFHGQHPGFDSNRRMNKKFPENKTWTPRWRVTGFDADVASDPR